MNRSPSRRRALQLAGGSLVALAGCAGVGDGPTGDETATPGDGPGAAAADDEPMLRFVHLSPDAGPLSVSLDGESLSEGLSFGTVTEYRPAGTGERAVTIDPAADGAAALEDTIELFGGPQTLAVFGETSAEFRSLDAAVLIDDDSPAEGGDSRIRVFHAIPDREALDVMAGETVLAEELTFGNDSAYVAVSTDVGQIQFLTSGGEAATPEPGTGTPTPTSTDIGETETVPVEETAAEPEQIATVSLDLAGGVAYTLYAAGYAEASGDRPGAELITSTDGSDDESEAVE
jgi:hypothetical protein